MRRDGDAISVVVSCYFCILLSNIYMEQSQKVRHTLPIHILLMYSALALVVARIASIGAR